MKKTHFIEVVVLTELDILSYLLAAACCSYGHDGFTNCYHMKKVTERAIKFNDVSI
jgi:hypothetical protein